MLQTWKRNSEPNTSTDQIALLVMRLYLARGLAPETLFSHRYVDRDGVIKQVNYPLYFSSNKGLASEERPLYIEEPITTRCAPFYPSDAQYIAWKQSRHYVKDSPTYRLVSIESLQDGEIRLSFDRGTYGQFLSSCEILYDELVAQLSPDGELKGLADSKGSSPLDKDTIDRLWNRLALRQQLAPDPAALETFTLRSAKLGITTALVFRLTEYGDAKGEFWMVPLSKRSTKLAEYPGYYGTVPAGTFQSCSLAGC